LFVDDDANVLNGLRRSLRCRQSGWQMWFAQRPEEALALARQHAFDVVVADMAMPDMNGLALLVALRRILPMMSAIVLTGTADLRCAIDSINQAGVFRFYTKPCPSFLLREGITAALELKRETATPAVPAARPSAPGLAPVPAPFPAAMGGGNGPLNLLSLGVIVVDAQARVRFMNRRAEELCAAGDGLILDGDHVCRTETAREAARLHQLIRDALASGVGGAMLVTRTSAKRPLSVLVALLPETAESRDTARTAVLLISDPNDITLPTPEQLASLFDLPPVKARIAHSLSQGYSLSETADLLGITYGTARTYLKDIFIRTATGRQSELIKLIITQPQVTFGVQDR